MDQIAFDRREVPREIEPFFRKFHKRRRRCLRRALYLGRQIRAVYFLPARAERDRALHGVFKLPDQ